MLDLYGVCDYHDPISEEFFAVLGTCLARQTSALVAAGPATAVVFDDDWLDAADEGVRALRTEVGAAWTARGRKVLSLRPGGLPLAEALDKALAGAGLAPADCLFLSGEEAACAEVRHARPDIPALAVPSDPDELAAFFEHTWELDTPGGRIPGPSWPTTASTTCAS